MLLQQLIVRAIPTEVSRDCFDGIKADRDEVWAGPFDGSASSVSSMGAPADASQTGLAARHEIWQV
jgi:hypothetical protein